MMPNSEFLLPPTSRKLSICHVMTVVNRRSAGPRSRGDQSASVTGCQVWCHSKSPVSTVLAGVPMLAPNVNSESKRRKKSRYQSGPDAIAIWVNAGSLSMNAVCGIAAYSSRQNQLPPERFRNRSVRPHISRQRVSVMP